MNSVTIYTVLVSCLQLVLINSVQLSYTDSDVAHHQKWKIQGILRLPQKQIKKKKKPTNQPTNQTWIGKWEAEGKNPSQRQNSNQGLNWKMGSKTGVEVTAGLAPDMEETKDRN